MEPMLIERTNPDTSTLTYPVYVFPKLDGIRCLIVDGVPKTRTLKDVPNNYIRSVLTSIGIDGFDGELIIGDAVAKSVYRDTNSVVMSHDKCNHFYYFVFDLHNHTGTFEERQQALKLKIRGLPINNNIILLESTLCYSEEELLNYEVKCLQKGYEGVIIRNPRGLYKYGRTTIKENNTFKLKRFVDGEAEILAIIEEQHNTNEKVTNELGKGQRSTHKENLVGKSTMGALLCKDVVTGATFQIGSGFTKSEREWFWNSCNVNSAEPVIVKYKSFPIGVKDKPRHPIYLGLRDRLDM